MALFRSLFVFFFETSNCFVLKKSKKYGVVFAIFLFLQTYYVLMYNNNILKL